MEVSESRADAQLPRPHTAEGLRLCTAQEPYCLDCSGIGWSEPVRRNIPADLDTTEGTGGGGGGVCGEQCQCFHPSNLSG